MRTFLLCLPLPFVSGHCVVFPPVALWVTVGLAVCLLVLLVALAVVCRRKIKESCEEARREGEATGGVPPPSAPVQRLAKNHVCS